MNPDEPHSPEVNGNPAESTGYACPKCGALLYSRRSRMCGACGALLPPETVLTDAQREAQNRERQWARDLADQLTSGVTAPTASRAAPAQLQPGEPDLEGVEAAVRRLYCAVEFQNRTRPTWFYVAGCAVSLLVEASIPLAMSRYLPGNHGGLLAYFILGGLTVFSWFVLWHRANPICPNCRQNIRTCLADFCQLCGKQLRFRRCTDCGVDNTWIGFLFPYRNGAYSRIIFCPGCGAELDTWIRRWYASD